MHGFKYYWLLQKKLAIKLKPKKWVIKISGLKPVIFMKTTFTEKVSYFQKPSKGQSGEEISVDQQAVRNTGDTCNLSKEVGI